MTTFEQSLSRTMIAVQNWEYRGFLDKITIIRDVQGKIALILETQRRMDANELKCLDEELKTRLGTRYRGNIYCRQNRNNDLVCAMMDEAENCRILLEEHNGTEWFLVERAIAKKAWVECNYQERPIWSFEEAQNGSKPKVVTFYSFKGGMGRTTALAATVLSLAVQGKNVLAIDTDIEAPGLATLFLDDGDIQNGTVDYLLETGVEEGPIDISGIVRQVTSPILRENVSGEIFIIPAGTIDQNYLQKLARIDYQDAVPNNMKRQLCRMIEAAVLIISRVCRIDYILLDSRAGFHDMGGVITAQIPQGIVLFGKDSRQSWQGLDLVLRAIATSQTEPPMVAIVDSACGQNGTVTVEEKKSFKEQSHMIFCESYYAEGEQQPGVEALGEAHSPIYVPYQPILADNIQLYSDGSIIQNERVRQIKRMLLGEEYQEIRKRIEQWFGDDEGDSDFG